MTTPADPRLRLLYILAVLSRFTHALADRRRKPEAKQSSLRRAARFGVGAAFTLLLGLGHAQTASAQAIYLVDSPADESDLDLFDGLCLTASGTCTLRAAIEQANVDGIPDGIQFAEGVAGQITLTLGELVITQSLAIEGPSLSLLSVSGDNLSRVFRVESMESIEVTISGLTIRDGVPAATDEDGGGILNVGQTLTLDRVSLASNSAPASLAGGGGLASIGNCGAFSVTIRDSLITGNTTNGAGGGIYICDVTTLTIERTEISGNYADGVGGGLFLGFAGAVTIEQVTISDNHSILNNGGGLWLDTGVGPGPALIQNSTISGNTAAANGGGVFVDSGPGLTVRHTTIAGNTASQGGGIYLNFDTLALSHTIVADGTAPADPDLGGSSSVTYTVDNSLVEVPPGSATFTNNGGNILSQDPQLAALENNGGPTRTHMPAFASPVVNAGDSGFAPPPATDQRGFEFARVAGGRIDIGAVERTVASLQLVALTPVFENESAFVTLTRDGGTDGDVSVTVTASDGTATYPEDYSATAVTVSWVSGDSDPKTVEIPLVLDFVPEPDETLTVALSNPAGGATLGAFTTDTLNILNDDTVPVLSGIANQAIDEDGTTGPLAFTVTDDDNAPLPIALSAFSSNQSLVPDGTSFAFSGAGANRAIQVTPAANQFGSALITVVASDGVNQAQTQFTLLVNSVVDSPIASNGMLTTNEDTGGSGTLVAFHGDGTPLTFSIVANGTQGTAAITNSATGAYTYTPNANVNGADSFTFKVNDGTVDSTVASVNVTITPVNDAPAASNGTLMTSEDTAGSGTLVGADVDANPLTFSIVANGTNGTAVVTNAATGAYTYTPNANAIGVDSFTFKVNDGTVDSSVATVTVSITAVNDAPAASNGAVTTNEDTAGSGTLGGTDVDGNPLTFSIVANGTLGTALITNSATGAYTYTPNANANGADSFTFKVNDGALDSTVATVNVTITPVNDAPTVSNGTLTTDEDTAGFATLMGADVDGDPLTFSIGANGSKGTAAITNAATGAYIYTTNPNTTGPDSFTFKVNDGTVDSTVGIVSVTITSVNDAPTASNGTLTINEDTAGSGTLVGTDVDVNPLTFSIVANGTQGTAAITNAATGAYTYTPNAHVNGADSFTFKVNDGTVDSSVATVNVTITPVNDAPTIGAIANQTIPASTSTGAIPFVVGDIDTNPASLTLQAVSSNAALVPNASVSFGGSGANRTVTVTPVPGQGGTTTITVTVGDGLASAQTPFTVTVLSPISITVQTPNGASSFVSDSALLTLQGTAASSLPITEVRWTTDRGASGVATIAPASGALNVSWTATLPLQAGGNVLTFIATDNAGRTASVAVSTQVGLLNYYLAEGATGPFFDAYVLLANPTSQPAPVRATYLTEAGSSIVETFTVPARTRITKRLDSVAGLESAQFTTTIASLNAVPLLIERAMFWDDRAYGGAVSAASEQLSRTWYFAEGSEQPVPLTVPPTAFDTYILLGNPGLVPANVTLQFLTEVGAIVTRAATVLPGRRLTVPTTGISELAGLSFATVVNADVPVIAERAQYFGPLYAGGHSSPGTALPSTTWNFAEGAVGPMFDTYFMVANPGDAAATLNLTYRLGDGRVLTITRSVPPHARGTIRAGDSIPADVVTPLWTSIVADRPVVVDRSMYWPGATPEWLASHSGVGTSEPNTLWGFAEGSVGGALEFATYLLLANPGNSAANVEISFLLGDGTTVVKNTPVAALQRLTLSIASFAPETVDQSFGMVVRVTNGVPVFAERSMYWTALGVPYAEGSNSPGIRIP